jgi:large subunit ribosomal protein L9
MKLILTADVSGLGGPGDVVEVKDGYGRNYLLPQGFAILSTKGAEKNVASIRRAQETRAIKGLDHAKEVKAAIEALGNVKIASKAAENSRKLFGSITTIEIAEAVKAQGGPVLDKRAIETDGHIKSVGKHPIQVRLHPEVSVKFYLEVSAVR